MTEAAATSNEVMGESLSSTQDESSASEQSMSDAAGNTQTEDHYATLVGEGRQYKSPQALAESKLNADRKIEELKLELATANEVASKVKTTDEILELIQRQEKSTEGAQGETPAGLTADNLEEWYAAHEAKRDEAANVATKVKAIEENQKKAWQLLSDKDAFGSLDNAKRAMSTYIGSDSVKADIINQMGGYTPEDLVDFLKAKVSRKKVEFSTDAKTVVSPGTYDSIGVLTWEKVKAAEKENPKLKKDLSWSRYVNQHLPSL